MEGSWASHFLPPFLLLFLLQFLLQSPSPNHALTLHQHADAQDAYVITSDVLGPQDSVAETIAWDRPVTAQEAAARSEQSPANNAPSKTHLSNGTKVLSLEHRSIDANGTDVAELNSSGRLTLELDEETTGVPFLLIENGTVAPDPTFTDPDALDFELSSLKLEDDKLSEVDYVLPESTSNVTLDALRETVQQGNETALQEQRMQNSNVELSSTAPELLYNNISQQPSSSAPGESSLLAVDDLTWHISNQSLYKLETVTAMNKTSVNETQIAYTVAANSSLEKFELEYSDPDNYTHLVTASKALDIPEVANTTSGIDTSASASPKTELHSSVISQTRFQASSKSHLTSETSTPGVNNITVLIKKTLTSIEAELANLTNILNSNQNSTTFAHQAIYDEVKSTSSTEVDHELENEELSSISRQPLAAEATTADPIFTDTPERPDSTSFAASIPFITEVTQTEDISSTVADDILGRHAFSHATSEALNIVTKWGTELTEPTTLIAGSSTAESTLTEVSENATRETHTVHTRAPAGELLGTTVENSKQNDSLISQSNESSILLVSVDSLEGKNQSRLSISTINIQEEEQLANALFNQSEAANETLQQVERPPASTSDSFGIEDQTTVNIGGVSPTHGVILPSQPFQDEITASTMDSKVTLLSELDNENGTASTTITTEATSYHTEEAGTSMQSSISPAASTNFTNEEQLPFSAGPLPTPQDGPEITTLEQGTFLGTLETITLLAERTAEEESTTEPSVPGGQFDVPPTTASPKLEVHTVSPAHLEPSSTTSNIAPVTLQVPTAVSVDREIVITTPKAPQQGSAPSLSNTCVPLEPPKSPTHEFRLVFNTSTDFAWEQVEALERRIQGFIGDTPCPRRFARTAFALGPPHILSWTDPSINASWCDRDPVDTLFRTMQSDTGHPTPEITHTFYPEFRISSVELRLRGACVPTATPFPVVATAAAVGVALSAALLAGLLTLLWKVLRMTPRRRSRKMNVTPVPPRDSFDLKQRRPILLPGEARASSGNGTPHKSPHTKPNPPFVVDTDFCYINPNFLEVVKPSPPPPQPPPYRRSLDRRVRSLEAVLPPPRPPHGPHSTLGNRSLGAEPTTEGDELNCTSSSSGVESDAQPSGEAKSADTSRTGSNT